METSGEAQMKKLLTGHIPLCSKLAKDQTNHNFQHSDLFGVALLAMTECYKKYDPQKGDFTPYAMVCVRRAIKDYKKLKQHTPCVPYHDELTFVSRKNLSLQALNVGLEEDAFDLDVTDVDKRKHQDAQEIEEAAFEKALKEEEADKSNPANQVDYSIADETVPDPDDAYAVDYVLSDARAPWSKSSVAQPCPHPDCDSSDAFSYNPSEGIGNCFSCNNGYPKKGVKYSEDMLEEYPLKNEGFQKEDFIDYAVEAQPTPTGTPLVQQMTTGMETGFVPSRGISEKTMAYYDVKTFFANS